MKKLLQPTSSWFFQPPAFNGEVYGSKYIIIMNFTTGCDNIMNDMGWLEMVDVWVDRLAPGAGVAVYYKIYWGGGRHVMKMTVWAGA